MPTETGRSRARIRRCAALAPVAMALVFPLSAQAIDPGVTFDSGSPAGKEYAIPIVQGRADGAGTQNQRAAANTAFGVGIRPPGGGGSAGGRHSGGSGGSAHRGGGASGIGGSGRATSGPTSAAAARALSDRIAHAEAPGGTGLWALGIPLAVMLPAALFALLLWRRPEQPADGRPA